MGRKVKSYTEEYKNTIIDLFNSGKTYAEISDEYGVPKTTIRQWVKKNNTASDDNISNNVEEIREAKDELVRISNDKEQREIYEMRSKILKDKVSALNEAERKGIEKGIKQGIEKGIKQRTVELAENLLDVLDNETISLKTGLTVDEIEQLRHK